MKVRKEVRALERTQDCLSNLWTLVPTFRNPLSRQDRSHLLWQCVKGAKVHLQNTERQTTSLWLGQNFWSLGNQSCQRIAQPTPSILFSLWEPVSSGPVRWVEQPAAPASCLCPQKSSPSSRLWHIHYYIYSCKQSENKRHPEVKTTRVGSIPGVSTFL